MDTKILAQFSYNPDSGIISRRGRELHPKPNSSGYLRVGIGKKLYQYHRLAWLIATGEWPDGEIDHINRDKTDNRLNNLRVVGRSANALNIGPRKDSKSGLIGVNWHSGHSRWHGYFRGAYLGSFTTIFEAAAVRISAESSFISV